MFVGRLFIKARTPIEDTKGGISMAEITGVKPEVKYSYKFNLNLSKEGFEHITALEKKYNAKGLKVWLAKELEERYQANFSSPALE